MMPNLGLYLTIIISFLVGVLLGRLLPRRSKLKVERPSSDREAYIRGLKYIISHQPDRAINEFTKAVKIDSNTIEIYQDLGNLFREKGDIGKAIQIHQSILLRPSLDRQLKISALMNLGQDYQKGDFIDRAVKIYQEVSQVEPDNLEAYQALEQIYEQDKKWESAFQMEKHLQKISPEAGGSTKLANLMTEMGKAAYEKSDYAQAIKSLKEAISLDKNCTEAFLVLGDIYFSLNKTSKAISLYEQIVFSDSHFPYSVYKSLERAYLQQGRYEKIESVYREMLQLKPQDARTRTILADYYYKKGLSTKAISELEEGLKINPDSVSLRSAMADMLVRDQRSEEAIREYQNLISQLRIKTEYYYCQKCGYQASDIQWKCPQCQEWKRFAWSNKA